MDDVKNMLLPNGATYSGAVKYDGNAKIPHGLGICKYEDHNETGIFEYGVLNGIGYINFHEYMYVGICQDNQINGWGIKAYRGGFQFGIFEDSELKVNLTPLVEIFWSKILEDCDILGKNPVSVLKSGEIFVGSPQTFSKGKMGFHSLGNGEVFLGRSEYDHKGRTGKFLHFDLDYNITRGEYKDGQLNNEIDSLDFVTACEAWSNHAYNDFVINMNFGLSSFLFNEKKLMRIVEMGRTPDNIIVKANICDIRGNRVECVGHTNANSVWFMFPNDNEEIEQELAYIYEREDPWSPIFTDYRVDFFNNFREANNNHQIVYKHASCWENKDYWNLDDYYETDPSEYGIEFDDEEDHDDDVMYSLIPDFALKKSQLEAQWRNNNWYYDYPSVRDYVKSLAYGDDVNNFFSWLFNDYSFNNASAWSLPQEHRMALEQFFNLFNDLDD